MFVLDSHFLNGLAAVLTGLSGLVWAFRRRR